MTHPDDLPIDDDEETGLDPAEVTAAGSEASEADVIEQAIAVPLGDDDFDR